MRGSDVRRALALLGLAGAVATLLSVTGTRLAASQGTVLTALSTEEAVPMAAPFDDFWDRVPEVEVPLSAQQTTPPKGGRRLTIRARAVHDAERLYMLVEWPDGSADRSLARTQDFTDAAAVQFPAIGGQQVPSFCMGDPNASVNIWQWRASSQLDLEAGFQGSVRTPYPNTVVDRYPFGKDELYHPGRYLENPVSEAEPRSAVENLVAGGFGSLTPDPNPVVTGWGEWRDGTWRVVFSRPLEVGREGNVRFAPGLTDVAFAVWDGAAEERDGMKSVASFLALRLSGESLGEGGGVPWAFVSILVLVGWLGLAAVLGSDLVGEVKP